MCIHGYVLTDMWNVKNSSQNLHNKNILAFCNSIYLHPELYNQKRKSIKQPLVAKLKMYIKSL